MQNLDSAVGRLDNIFMSLYVLIAFIIFAAVLVKFSQFYPYLLRCSRMKSGYTCGHPPYRRWSFVPRYVPSPIFPCTWVYSHTVQVSPGSLVEPVRRFCLVSSSSLSNILSMWATESWSRMNIIQSRRSGCFPRFSSTRTRLSYRLQIAS